jgi:tRNA-uridine 2-sulfurtransferase
MKEKRKIVVAMSGGVDSSTVAAMLKEQGNDVIGVTLNLCKYSCSEDAKKVAKELKIEHYDLDLRKDFHKNIISYFVSSYISGETPNPCAICNKKIKFGLLCDFAKNLGAEALATGHYVRKVLKDDEVQLHKAADPSKDQSYFLFAIDNTILPFLEFPLGEYKKTEVRKIAKKYGLSVAEKSESQDVCFIPDGDYVSLIKEHSNNSSIVSGNFIDINGNVLGQHDGIINYTIGQRRGLGIAKGKPLYVTKIDAKTNSITLGDEKDLESHEFYIRDTNWFIDPTLLKEEIVDVKVRSAHKGSKATICSLTDSRCKYKITFLNQCKSIAPGQACVVYSKNRVLGGGIICSDIN